MRIAEIETVAYTLPFKEPYVTARGTLDRRELLLLRIRTDEGLEGLGEGVPLSLRGGESLARVERSLRRTFRRLRRLDPMGLVGEDPLAEAIDAYVHVAAGRRLPAPAAAALETAIFDLTAKLSRQPLWRLLRAKRAEPVRCNATLASGDPEAVATIAQQWAGRGFTTFKLKLGTGDDVRQVKAVRDAVGPDARIRVDANAAFGVEEALALLRDLEPMDVELAEQPVGSLGEMAAVAAKSPIPLAADESVSDRKEAERAVELASCRYATAKLSKVGGIGAAGAVAGALPTYLSSALDGPVGIAAAAHATQAIYRNAEDPKLAHGLATQELFAETVAERECELHGDELHLPEGPGLGVELDEDALARHRI